MAENRPEKSTKLYPLNHLDFSLHYATINELAEESRKRGYFMTNDAKERIEKLECWNTIRICKFAIRRIQ